MKKQNKNFTMIMKYISREIIFSNIENYNVVCLLFFENILKLLLPGSILDRIRNQYNRVVGKTLTRHRHELSHCMPAVVVL